MVIFITFKIQSYIMRNKLLLSLSCFVVIALFYSCTKNDNPTPINGKKIKTIKTISGSDIFYTNYFYNSDGTLNYFEIRNSNSYSKTTYTYNTNKIISKTFDSLNVLIAYGESLLRSDGLIDSSLSYFVSNIGPLDSISTNKFIYNSSNEPVQIKYYKAPFSGSPGIIDLILNNTFSNGNLVKQTNSGSQYFYIYEYYNTVSNLTPEAYGLPYNLLQSINLVKTIKQVNSLNPSDIQIYSTHVYSYDSDNRVVTHSQSLNGGNVIYEYTYY